MKNIVNKNCQQRSWASDTGLYQEMDMAGIVLHEEILKDDPFADEVKPASAEGASDIVCPNCRKAIEIKELGAVEEIVVPAITVEK